MPPSSLRYTLVGYSPELDWKTLHFVKHIASHRICSACGLVRNKMAYLPCTHVLCDSCYGPCRLKGSHTCPLDGNHCEDRQVGLMDYPPDDLLRREVYCWNKASGCKYATAASRITQHFLQCQYHTVCCRNCSATVQWDSVIEHLKSGSCSLKVPLASQSQLQAGFKDERVLLKTITETFKMQASEITKSLGKMADDIGAHGDRLIEICRSINIFEEALRQEIVLEKRENLDSSTRTLAEIAAFNEDFRECLIAYGNTIQSVSKTMQRLEGTLKKALSDKHGTFSETSVPVCEVSAQAKQSSEEILDRINNVLRHVTLQTASCEYFVERVSSLQEEALSSGSAEFYSEKVCLRGYCMSPGMAFQKHGTSVTVKACFRLHKGDMDDAIQWPFEHTVKRIVMHPKDGKGNVQELKPHRCAPANRRPTRSFNEAGYFKDWLNFDDLISDGYVQEDRLRIKWELLP